MQINQSLRRVSFVFPIALVALLVASPTGAETKYILNPVPPNYIEAKNVIEGFTGDDSWWPIRFPFPFTFYGHTYDPNDTNEPNPWIYVSTNGYINFLNWSSSYSNTCLPEAGEPNGAIYAFWDDLYVDDSASVRTELLGTEPNRQFVIEWRNATFYNNRERRIDFEIVLSETGAILLQYRNIDGNIDSGDTQEMGNSATIGLENQPGTEAVQFSCPTDSLISVTSNISTFVPIGPGEFALGSSELATTRTVAVDIKPMGCPNPLNVNSNGVLPVAILGTADFDVTGIDPTTVTLDVPSRPVSIERVAPPRPLRWSLEDVGTPSERLFGKADEYECNTLGADGHLDMVFKFDTQAVAAALDKVEDREVLTLQVNGNQMDGTEFRGEDVVLILKGGKEK